MLSSASFAASSEKELFTESVRLYSDGKFSESALLLRQLTKKSPNKALYWFNLGNCAFMEKNFSQAQQHYRKVIALGGNLTLAARFYQAKTYRALGKVEFAEVMLIALSKERLPPALAKEVKADLDTLEVQAGLEEKALTAYQAKNYAEAEALLLQEGDDKLSTSGRLLLGLSYVRQSKAREAEKTLNQVLSLPMLSSEDRATASDLLKKVRQNELENVPYWLFVDLAYGTTNNLYLDGKSSPALSSSLVRASLAVGYHFNQGKTWSEKLGYILNYESPQQASELKTVVHTLQAPLLYRNGDYESTLTAYLQQQSWNDSAASQRTGISWKPSITTNNYEAGFDLDMSSQKAADSAFSYLSGNGTSLRPFYGLWGASLYGQLYYLVGSDGTQDIVFADASRLPMTHKYRGPGLRLVWKPSLKTLLSWDLSQLKRTYDNPSLPGGTQRIDNELATTLKFSYTLSPGLSAYGLAESIKNESTLKSTDVRDKNYEALVLTLGLSWEAF